MHSGRKDKGERKKEGMKESPGSTTKAMKIPSIRLDYPEIPEDAPASVGSGAGCSLVE